MNTSIKSDAIFRKVALDRLASPEQLDQLMPVTDARGWIALAAAAAVLLTGAIWSITARLPQNVLGTGILINGGGVFEVMPAASGRIADVSVHVGDEVTDGQVVARMEQPELSERLRQAEAALAALESQGRDLVAFGIEDRALRNKQVDRQRDAISHAIASARKSLEVEAQKLARQKQLVVDGLLLQQTLLDTVQRHNAALERMRNGETQLAELEVEDLGRRNQRQSAVFTSDVKIAEAKRLVDEIARELGQKTVITSRYNGRILEVLTERGRMVATGEPLMRLDQKDREKPDLDAVIYVSSVYGKQIKAGMRILLSPAAVKPEEFGRLIGRVVSVSALPATTLGMQRMLKNEQLVHSLARGDAPFEVRADLVVDRSTASGFKWSSSKGPPTTIESGTMTSAFIEVDERRPVELVVPLLREVAGL